MALGDLILDETVAMTGGVRVLPNDEPGTKVEVCAQGAGTIRGVAETSMYTYTQLQRPDGSIYGEGRGIITTKDGDVIVVTASGSVSIVITGANVSTNMVSETQAPAVPSESIALTSSLLVPSSKAAGVYGLAHA